MAKKEYLKKKKTTENVFARTLNYMGRVGRLGFEPGNYTIVQNAVAKVVKIWHSAKFSLIFLTLQSADSSSFCLFGPKDICHR